MTPTGMPRKPTTIEHLSSSLTFYPNEESASIVVSFGPDCAEISLSPTEAITLRNAITYWANARRTAAAKKAR